MPEKKSTFDNVWTKIGGRKLIAFFLGITALVLLAFFDKLTETAMYGILGLAACFAGGNVGEHISSAIKARASAFLGSTPAAPAAAAVPAATDEDTEE